MPTERRRRSEGEARELVDWGNAYGALCPGEFGGAWFDYIDEYPVTFAAFVGDLARHRAALDPRIEVVAAGRTAGQRDELIAQIRSFVDGYEGARVESMDFLAYDGGRLVLEVEATDEAAFDRDLRERFGTFADVYYQRYDRVTQPFTTWRTDATDHELTVWWTSGDSANTELAAEEGDQDVRLTLSRSVYVDSSRSETSVGEEIIFGNTGPESWEQSASVTLQEPLGDRVVIDTSTGRRARRGG